MPQLKMHLANSPSLRAAYTGQYAEIFSSEPSKGAPDAFKSGIAKSEIACIGDSENDLSMFEAFKFKEKLVAKGFIKEKERSNLPGRPILYETTSEFLDYFGLANY